MAKTKENKTSYLAVASILLIVSAFAMLILESVIVHFFSQETAEQRPVFTIPVIVMFFLFAAGVLVGITALFVIQFSKNDLGGEKYAKRAVILGLIFGTLFFVQYCIAYEIRKMHKFSSQTGLREEDFRLLAESKIQTTRTIKTEAGFLKILLTDNPFTDKR
jgi:hypothetical protein